MWKGARPIGLSIALEDGQSLYYPWGHASGDQYNKQDVLAWVKREFRGKKLVGHNLKFDLLMLEAEGVDLRHHQNEFDDTMLIGPLLDEHGFHGLDKMAAQYLGARKTHLRGISKTRMQDYPSHAIAEYAEQDAALTLALFHQTMTHLEQEELSRVYQLERRVLPAVMEMELNGLHVDVRRLHQWCEEVEAVYKQETRDLGFLDVNSSQALQRHYDKMGWVYWYNLECGACEAVFPGPETCLACEKCGKEQLRQRSAHFGEGFLSQDRNPLSQRIIRLRKLGKLLGSYLRPWCACIKEDGLLRFELNQLRRDEGVDGARGTITGRFSSNKVFDGAQPQQIWNAEKQEKQLGPEWIMRKLFIARQGLLKAQCDASQIEFRLFGHYSKAPRIIDSYKKDPLTDFHELVKTQVLQNRISRKEAKGINFGKIYGMGVDKFCRSLGVSVEEGSKMIAEYDQLFPEAKQLKEACSTVARRQRYVRTIYGRKGRFIPTDGTHKALNKVIQGSAGDIMKERTAAFYENRHHLDALMEVTVHDELLWDTGSEAKAQEGKKMLEDFSLPLRVPLVWELAVGHNWAMSDD